MASALSSEELGGIVVYAALGALAAENPLNCTCPQLETQAHVLKAYSEVRALKTVGRVSVCVGHGMLVFALSKEKDDRLYTTLDDWPAGEKIAGFLTFPVENAAAMLLRVNEMLLGAYVRAEALDACCAKERLANYIHAISLIHSDE